jgi:hypothetical protein
MEQTSGKSLALRESVMELFIEQKVDHENRPHFFTFFYEILKTQIDRVEEETKRNIHNRN